VKRGKEKREPSLGENKKRGKRGAWVGGLGKPPRGAPREKSRATCGSDRRERIGCQRLSLDLETDRKGKNHAGERKSIVKISIGSQGRGEDTDYSERFRKDEAGGRHQGRPAVRIDETALRRRSNESQQGEERRRQETHVGKPKKRKEKRGTDGPDGGRYGESPDIIS